jgi:HEAT repeats/Putative zinc-finger
MNCDQISNEIPLYYYGELEQEEEERIEQHLADCAACTAELERVRSFGRTMTLHEAALPDDLLYDSRAALARALRLEHTVSPKTSSGALPRATPVSTWIQHLREWMNMGIGMRVPAGALALVAVGFLAGKVAPGTLPWLNRLSMGSGAAQQAGFISVRSVEPDPSGGVRIAFDRVSRDTVSGSVDDAKIREMLLSSMHDESNAGLRVEAMGIAKDHAHDADVRGALVEALQTDPNIGVRLQALEGLKQYAGDADVRKALTATLLNDANAGVRVKVIDLLTARKDDSMVGTLQTLVGKEQNGYVRTRASDALREMKASVGTF